MSDCTPPEAGFPASPIIIGNHVALSDGDEFESVMQWPFLDLNTFNADKELKAFDLSVEGVAAVSFGWDQRQTEYNPRTWTDPYTICGDTVPGTELPFSITGPSFAMRITFTSGQPWRWFSADMHIEDNS